MAMDYDGSPNGLFLQLGKIAKHYNLQKTDATDLSADGTEIANVFEAMTSGEPGLMLEGFATEVDGWKDEFTSRREFLAALATIRLQDKVTVLDQIGASSDTISEVLRKLILAMVAGVESVDASAVSVGSVTAGGSNSGSGTVLTTLMLDGVTSPGAGAIGTYSACAAYLGSLTQLCVPSETMRLECVADSFVDGSTEGDESFTWEGRLAAPAHGFREEGSGSIGTIKPVNGAANLLSNGDFETWATSAPVSWDIVAGVAGAAIVQETTLADRYHGDSGLVFIGDGAVSPEIIQPIDASLLQGGKRYCVTCRIKASATIAAGDLEIIFTGTGYTAGAAEKISVAHGSLPTAWTLESFFVNLPLVIPSDFGLTIRWKSTPTTAKKLWIDDVAFGPVNYGGGLGVVIVRGAAPFIRGDLFTFTVANNDAGTFQAFFRRCFGVQLPSDAGGTETIDDALAT